MLKPELFNKDQYYASIKELKDMGVVFAKDDLSELTVGDIGLIPKENENNTTGHDVHVEMIWINESGKLIFVDVTDRLFKDSDTKAI